MTGLSNCVAVKIQKVPEIVGVLDQSQRVLPDGGSVQQPRLPARRPAAQRVCEVLPAFALDAKPTLR